jgi:hypothetical protein
MVKANLNKFSRSNQKGGAVLVLVLGLVVALMSMMLIMSVDHQRIARTTQIVEQTLVDEQMLEMVLETITSRIESSEITESGTYHIHPEIVSGYRMMPADIKFDDSDKPQWFDIRFEALDERSASYRNWRVFIHCANDECSIERMVNHNNLGVNNSQEAAHEQ